MNMNRQTSLVKQNWNWCLEIHAWKFMPGNWCLEIDAWKLMPGNWCLEIDAWKLMLGNSCLEIRKRRKAWNNTSRTAGNWHCGSVYCLSCELIPTYLPTNVVVDVVVW
jgi:hypothetical protein